MAIYQWVGGHTGYTGPNSGFSPTGGGASGMSPLWTSGYNGATSDQGDFVFSPYFWGNTKNWLKVISATGSIGNYNYVPTTTLPKGGDTVWYQGFYVGATGLSFATYSVSCLYGGMSGDGFTASGLTNWAGYTATASTDIQFLVYPSFMKENHPSGFDTGRIGAVSSGSSGGFDGFYPLNIRSSYFTFVNQSPSPQVAPKVALNCISTSTASQFSLDSQSSYNGQYYYGVAYLKGKWESVFQNTGSVFLTDITNSNGGWYNAQGNIVRFSASPTTAISTYAVNPFRLKDGAYIWGNYGSQAVVNVTPYVTPNHAAVTLGSLNDGSTATFTEVTVGYEGGATVGGALEANIKLASCQIDYLKVWAGDIGVSPLLTQYDYPIVRDGFMKSGTLDMSHPNDPTWKNFLLAYSGGDNGLRIDSPTQVTIKPYIGMSIKTGAVEGTTG